MFCWSVDKLARAITKWTRACDKRLARLISYVHHTSEFKQYCHVGSNAQQCKLGLFQDSDFAGDLEDSESTSVESYSFFGSHTFVPKRWYPSFGSLDFCYRSVPFFPKPVQINLGFVSTGRPVASHHV